MNNCDNHRVRVVATADGSSTFCGDRFQGQHYHSLRGAQGEAQHVYVRFLKSGDRVLEIGFGSGLNALLSLQTGLLLHYTTVELYPVGLDVLEGLSFNCSHLRELHASVWENWCRLTPEFSFRKLTLDISDASELPLEEFDVVFFDAFAPDIVPEQWTVEVFSQIAGRMAVGAKLLTYSAKGVVKRALREAGLEVKRLEGALGKHNMLVATKL